MALTKKRKVDQEQEHDEEEQVQQEQYSLTEHQAQQQGLHHTMASNESAAAATALYLPTNTENEEDEDDEEIAKLLEPLSRDRLISLLCSAATSDPVTRAEIRRLADLDPSHRKIFVHGLNWNTNSETLRAFFSQHGEIDDCRVVTDRNSGKSKGYGFVMFQHRKSARRALRSPQNLIDGRMTACQLASIGPTGQGQVTVQHQHAPSRDNLSRKIYVGNVHHSIDGSRLLEFFSRYGEIEEGPLGFDRQTGKPKGFALFIYKTVEGARTALEEPNKNFEGHALHCERAMDGQKQKATAAASPMGPIDSGFSGNAGYNVHGGGGGGGYNVPVSAGDFNGTVDMGMGQGIMYGSMPFGQGMPANTAALAMLVAAGQNPAAFGVPPGLLASLNPALAAAMSSGTAPVQNQTPMQSQGYNMGNSGYQNVGYQGPQPPVTQSGLSYQGAPMGQAPASRPPMGPMGGYGPH